MRLHAPAFRPLLALPRARKGELLPLHFVYRRADRYE